jgi:putative addiction module component (TIGR02574 family)
MTKAELQAQALQLPVDERLELAEALWESVEQEPAQPAVEAWQRQRLDERIAAANAAHAAHDAGSRWQKIKRKILSSL